MKIRRGFQGREVEIEARLVEDELFVRLPDGTEKTVHARRRDDGTVEVRDGNRVFRVVTAREASGNVVISWEGQSFTFETLSPTGTRGSNRAAKTSGSLIAPMVGTVSAVHVQPGDRVEAYQPVVVVEAMKVLATLEAPFAGTVKTVSAQVGQTVQQGEVLVEVSPERGEEPVSE